MPNAGRVVPIHLRVVYAKKIVNWNYAKLPTPAAFVICCCACCRNKWRYLLLTARPQRHKMRETTPRLTKA